ncbi:MAG: MMPL family transporter [Methanobacteriota archaeon]|nr:MAG: MMPL family transporter [Euryarchaeota archaeon]
MIFAKLADIVVKHYKKILALWLVILLLAIPAIARVNDVLAYQESEMVEGDIESLLAQEIVEEQFPTNLANSTLMVVVVGPDMTSSNARDFALELGDAVLAADEISYLEDSSSVYSLHEAMIAALAFELGPMTYELEQQVNSTAGMLYGIPALYMNTWIELQLANASMSVAELDNATYLLATDTLEDMLLLQDETTSQASWQYFNSFAYVWNTTSSNSTLVADPFLRANYCISIAAPAFVNELDLPYEQKAIMETVLLTFDLESYSNATLVHAFSVSTVSQMAEIEDLVFLEEVYALGPDYTYDECAVLARQIVSSGPLSEYPVLLPDEYMEGFLSPDNSAMLIVFSFSKASNYMEDGEKPIVTNVDVLRELVADARDSHLNSDYEVYVTGDAALTADMESSMENEMMLIEPITIIMIIVLMGFFFRSVVAQFVPLGSVMVALGVSQAMVFVIGSFVADVHYSVTMMLFSILMGVGTDYAIFIVARYREERIKGHVREEAVRTSVTWAGESISTSGATVMISFFALAIADFSMIRTMGLVMGMAIGIALLVALTLVPSILMLLGNRVFWPNNKARWYRYAEKFMARREAGHRGYFHKAATFSIRHAKAVMAAAIIISIPTTYVFVTAETSFDFIEGMSSGVESNEGITAMTEAFGAGRIMPTQIVLVMSTPVYENGNFSIEHLDAVDAITSSMSDVENVKQVTGTTNPQGPAVDYRNLSYMPSEQRASLEALMLESIGTDRRTVLITVVLEAGPMTAESLDTVEVIRNLLVTISADDPVIFSSEIYVGGATAVIYDLANDLNEQFDVMEIVVVIGIFLVLLIVLGAVLLSLFAIISILLSISWAFAATVGIFGYALDQPILWIIPLILFIMLMGIGMDYNVFILTRIREEKHKGKSNEAAIVESLDWTGGIITALAIIMGSAFSMMMISSTMMLREMGFALAFAIMLDAMVVRTYIVPAMMTILGKWAWWAPGRLQREGRDEKRRHRDT